MTEGFFVGSPQSEEIFSGAIREVKEETGVTKNEHIRCHSFPSDISFYVFPTHANPFSPLFYPFRLTLHFWKWLLSGKSSQLRIQPAIKENLVHFCNTTLKKSTGMRTMLLSRNQTCSSYACSSHCHLRSPSMSKRLMLLR